MSTFLEGLKNRTQLGVKKKIEREISVIKELCEQHADGGHNNFRYNTDFELEQQSLNKLREMGLQVIKHPIINRTTATAYQYKYTYIIKWPKE